MSLLCFLPPCFSMKSYLTPLNHKHNPWWSEWRKHLMSVMAEAAGKAVALGSASQHRNPSSVIYKLQGLNVSVPICKMGTLIIPALPASAQDCCASHRGHAWRGTKLPRAMHLGDQDSCFRCWAFLLAAYVSLIWSFSSLPKSELKLRGVIDLELGETFVTIGSKLKFPGLRSKPRSSESLTC